MHPEDKQDMGLRQSEQWGGTRSEEERGLIGVVRPLDFTLSRWKQ